MRFEAQLPNECWQSDVTHYQLVDGTPVEIINFLDDHSRLCVASVVVEVTKTTDVVRVFHQARANFGTPASVLSDNGAVYTGKYRLGRVLFEDELERLGVAMKHSKPNHPQTCGKVERFHQTLKRYLARQRLAASSSSSARLTASSPTTTTNARAARCADGHHERSSIPR